MNRETAGLTQGGRSPRRPKNVNEQALRIATERLIAQFRPNRVILFGSQARGTADEHSDVDLLVVCSVGASPGSRRALMVAMGPGSQRAGLCPGRARPDAGGVRARPVTSLEPSRVRHGGRESCFMKLPDPAVLEKVKQWLYADEDLRFAHHGFSLPDSRPYHLIA